MIPTITNPTSRTRRIASTAAIAAAAMSMSACGALIERATEEVVEEAVEQAIESENGGDVEVEFNSDGIQVEGTGDNGETINIEVDENGVQIDGTDADGNDFSVDGDEGGVEFDSENGESVEINEDGTFTSTNEDGEVTTGEFGEDGFVIEGEDGESVFRQGAGIPDEWPGSVPQPSGLADVQHTYSAEPDTVFIILGGTASGNVEDVFAGYTGALESAGFEQQAFFSDASSQNGTYQRGDESVSVTASDLSGEINLGITYGSG